MHIVLSACRITCIILCILYTQCTVYTVQCTMYSVYNIHYTYHVLQLKVVENVWISKTNYDIDCQIRSKLGTTNHPTDTAWKIPLCDAKKILLGPSREEIFQNLLLKLLQQLHTQLQHKANLTTQNKNIKCASMT